jgi:hypothetical protein
MILVSFIPQLVSFQNIYIYKLYMQFFVLGKIEEEICYEKTTCILGLTETKQLTLAVS